MSASKKVSPKAEDSFSFTVRKSTTTVTAVTG